MTESPSPQAPRILVADDHEWIRTILVQVAAQTLPDAEIIATENGAEALQIYRQRGADFLVSNHQMPGLDGPALVRQVRQQTPGLPILMVSVHPEVRAEALASGANWFLSKKQIMEELPPLLLRYVGRNPSLLPGKQA